jgi:hypothetical protein
MICRKCYVRVSNDPYLLLRISDMVSRPVSLPVPPTAESESADTPTSSAPRRS